MSLGMCNVSIWHELSLIGDSEGVLVCVSFGGPWRSLCWRYVDKDGALLGSVSYTSAGIFNPISRFANRSPFL